MYNMTHPDCVLKFKQKGTSMMSRVALYFLYRVISKWDPGKKRSKIKTGEHLGRITPEGLIEPKTRRIVKRYDQISVKEYASSFFLQQISVDLIASLMKYFPEWKAISVFACMCLVHVSPMKNVDFHYRTLFLSETIRDARVSPDVLGV